MDSLEITEWKAFERAHGPIGREWEHETLASIQEQIQFLTRVVGGQYEENPAPEPKRYPRPNEMFLPQEEQQAAEEEQEQSEPVGNADALNAYFDQLESSG